MGHLPSDHDELQLLLDETEMVVMASSDFIEHVRRSVDNTSDACARSARLISESRSVLAKCATLVWLTTG